MSPIKCKFGRFGETTGVIANATHVKCTSPATDESPDSIYRETVTIAVAMNGQDFEEEDDSPEFTFIGTSPYVSFASILLTLGAVAFVLVAAVLCLQSGAYLNSLLSANQPYAPQGPSGQPNRSGMDRQMREPAGPPLVEPL